MADLDKLRAADRQAMLRFMPPHMIERFAGLWLAGKAAGRRDQAEADAELLNMTRPQAQLMAGEMTAGEWRTVSAILVNRAKAIREAAK